MGDFATCNVCGLEPGFTCREHFVKEVADLRAQLAVERCPRCVASAAPVEAEALARAVEELDSDLDIPNVFAALRAFRARYPRVP